MTRKPLAQLFAGQPALPRVDGIVDAVLRDADGTILQHVHQHNLVTEYHRVLFTPNGDFSHSAMNVFIHESAEPMHVKRNSMRTTMPGTWAMSATPTLDGPNRIWTYQVVFVAPPIQRTVRIIGLCRWYGTAGYTNLKVGPNGIDAATLLSTPIVQPTSSTLEISYRLAIQRT